ncbi:putative glycolipid-binding domain-containing protein [Variovorax sp. PBL-E5]|uniref:putative glycolipid-binding domain-containing protein n=1 Tax=Variovorax sp. PBL-E5 TaxID=434014 RepID=UPI001E5E4C72|nr:putative glycolipid-binding domain-containing protein [Variovorax sp. PBL-E5]
MRRMQTVASMLWRRLGTPGHDVCRLERAGEHWQIDGAAVFRGEDGRAAQLHYRVRCDRAWHTQWGTVRGWLGGEAIDLSIVHDAHGGWKLNDTPVPELGHCVDLDMGFTPATNLLQLRRLHLAPGEASDAPVAWIDLDNGSLAELHQRYERRSESGYWYTAPRFDYAAMLEVTGDGFVRSYPKLWEAET